MSVLKDGVPDDAYRAVGSDDRDVARRWRAVNISERRGQFRLEEQDLEDRGSAIESEFAALMSLDETTADDVVAKAQIFDSLRSSESWLSLRTACDIWTSAFFFEHTAIDDGSSMAPTTGAVRRALSNPFGGVDAQVRAASIAASEEFNFFHWGIEFPEVLGSGGFDLTIGNPPFLGGKRISSTFGDQYRKYVKNEHAPVGNTTDLCALFFRRSATLLRADGMAGFVATNTIGQGDTRESGLSHLLSSGWQISYAHRFVKWPGTANVEVNLVCLSPQLRTTGNILDGQLVGSISSRLDTEPENDPEKLRIARNGAFQGSNIRGSGFILDVDEAQSLLRLRPDDQECIRPFLVGRDVNNRSDSSPSRYVINFYDWERNRAESHPILFDIVKNRVLPDRLKIRHAASRKKNVDYFWRYDGQAKGLYQTIHDLSNVLVRSRVSEVHAIAIVSARSVFSEATIVFPFDDYYHFALLQSNVHEAWVRRNASTMRTDIRYTPSDCFETFAFPVSSDGNLFSAAERIGRTYECHRADTLLERRLGLTKAYNLFNSPDCKDADIAELRRLHAEVDLAILACYDWGDLVPEHGFHENARGQTKFTVSDSANREIILRLLDLNLEIANKER